MLNIGNVIGLIKSFVGPVKNALQDKQDAPATAGTSGQVLGLDANLKPEWKTVSGGGTVDSSLSTLSENPVQNKVITGVLNDVKESFPNDAYTRGAYNPGWEQGALDPSTGAESSNSLRIRTDYIPIGEEVLGSFQSGANQEYWVRIYNGNKQFIGSGKVNSSGKITGTESGLAAVSYDIDIDSAAITVPKAKYIRLVVKYPNNATITPSDCKLDMTGKRGTFAGYSLEAIYKRKKKADYSSSDLMFYYDIGNGYYTRGFLKLPSNYTTSDRPVPLVVFVHGSADVTSINATSMTANYNTYYNYIRDCGYAVFDCYAYSSKYPTAGVNTWGIPINNACYEAGIRYVCEKFNIDIDNVFVSCKSQGGTQAFSMLMNPFMPIKAVGMLAPELWMLQMKFGYNANDRHTIATELGFSEDTGHVMDFTNGTDPIPEGFYDYITANMDKWCGYCANFAGLPITNANKQTYYTHPTSYQTGSMSRIGLNRPLKIWIASDDDAVLYDSADAVVKSFQNGGQIAQLRTMPANTGKHHAVDTDANALQTTNVTTQLGVTYATIPTAYYELVKFFDQYVSK